MTEYDPHAGKTEAELTMMFPAELKDWRCPACGGRIVGSYDIDETRKRCTKRAHTHGPVRMTYVRRDLELAKLRNLLVEMQEEGDAATGVERAIEVLS